LFPYGGRDFVATRIKHWNAQFFTQGSHPDDMNPDIQHHSTTNLMRSDSMMTEQRERHAPEIEQAGGAVELKTYFNLIVDNFFLILAVALVVSVAGILYALGSKPVYEANMTIQVEEANPNAARNILSEASSLFETKKAAVAEMELLRSRAVLAPVVDTLGMTIDAQPSYFPVIGAAIARARGDALSKPGLFGYGGYAWGSEKLEVSTLKAQGALLHRTFVVTATGDNGYRLSDKKKTFTWEGRVGIPLRGKISGLELEVLVTHLDAQAGAQFRLTSLPKQALIAAIQVALQITEQGKQSGIVEVRMQGENPEVIRAILDEMAREYFRQSIARRRASAEQSLELLNTQLVVLRKQLDQSDAHYSQLRHRYGTVNPGDEGRFSVEQAAAAKARRAELEQRKVDLQTRYGDRHPLLIAVNDQLATMDRAARADGVAANALLELEQDELKITRDNKVKSDMYAALSNTAQQLRILAISKTSNARLVDAPTLPDTPIKPNRPLIMSAAVMLGLFLGMVAAFAKRALTTGIERPKAVRKMVGTRGVQVSVPHSSHQQQLVKQAERGSGSIPMLARVAPEDAAIEALRGFRAALQYSRPHLRNNIVMIAGPTSHLGKSFIAANSATVIAASGERVLLIDADLRKGHLQQYFGSEQTPGLCDCVSGALALDAVIRRQVMNNLDFIPAGSWPRNPGEFLSNANFASLLASVSKQYDLVLIAAPHVLGVTDALIIGAHAGAVFLLARAGMTSEDETNEAIRRLNQAGIAPEGILFNDVPLRLGAPEYPSRFKETQQPIDCAG
jgi:tyrosine-protein kinase Etk/Wzc